MPNAVKGPPVHRDRRRRIAELQELGRRGEWESLYQRLMLIEFPREARMGWQLAILRTAAAPRMARILTAAGHFVEQPVKRAYDTGLIIYELVYGGPESERGRAMIKLMNRSHHGRGIEQEDLTYVLCAMIVAAFRYIDHAGWRKLTELELRSGVEYWRDIGRLMAIDRLPEDYAEAERLFDTYEARYVAPSPEGRLIGDRMLSALKGRLPRPGRPIARLVFVSQLGDPRVVAALGLAPAPRPVQWVADTAARIHGLVQRQRPPRTEPIFTPGQKAGTIYPHGYELDQLGPS